MKYKNIIGYSLVVISLIGVVLAMYYLSDVNDYWDTPEIEFPRKFVEVAILLFIMLIGVLLIWKSKRK